ncbi:energy transducer TonB [Marinoscillum furvescens]|uniref:TonB family protein n=1 Tax=Marinoscillum furvescens DSM 4134 TaxID=1122208 RepID=A0A3D9KY14_MARFU|nr:energy transducer TonB [Marinoscillum furvescens]RED93038.1 TonB family protein [Marinoscillum furvescens DSM 4134]
MLKTFIFLAVFLYTSQFVFAQETLLGRILDGKSRKPLEGVTVATADTTVTSNNLGFFQIPVKPGAQLSIQKPGFVNAQYKVAEQLNILVVLQPQLEQPEYRSGEEAFYKHLAEGINYPDMARRMGIEGTFFAAFKIDTVGKVSDIEILGSIMPEFDQEIVRLLSSLPDDWTPAKEPYQMVLPVTYKLGREPRTFSHDVNLEGKHVITPLVISALGAGSDEKPSDLNEGMMSFKNQLLDEVPYDLFRQDQLTVLDLENNRLSTLPQFMPEFEHLRNLNLSRNFFRKLPPVLFEISSLEILDLSKNRLLVLPDEVGNLSSLKILKLNKNDLTSLPESLAYLKQLERLEIKKNDLPEELILAWQSRLPHVEIIY